MRGEGLENAPSEADELAYIASEAGKLIRKLFRDQPVSRTPVEEVIHFTPGSEQLVIPAYASPPPLNRQETVIH